VSARLVKTATPGIYKRGSRYVVTFRDPYGKARKKSARTLAEARALKAQLTADVRRGEYRALSKVTFVEYAPEWIEHYNGRTSRGIREATKADYRTRLEEAIAFFGRMQLAAIEPGDVKRYAQQVAGRGLAPNTIRLVLAPVKALFATAVEDGLIRSNPTTGLRLALSNGDEEKVKALTEEELGRLLAEIPAQWQLFFDLLAATGLRIGEAIALRWCDVDFDRRRVLVRRRYYRGSFAAPKSRYGRRDVPLTQRLASDLEARWLLEDDVEGLVFPSAAGTVLEHSNLMGRVLKPAARRAGVPWVGFHTFRHTCATVLFRRGLNAKQVQVWLGHHSPAFTLTVYVHLLSDDLPDADVLDGLDGGNGVATSPTEISRNEEAAETAHSGMAPRQGSLRLVP
jgi:integrase